MTFARLFAAMIGALILIATAAPASSLEAPYEEPIQYALENLTSGIATKSVVMGVEVEITPIRTWKSVSGHYCRRYEIRIGNPGEQPVAGEKTRCRERTGTWLPVAEN